MKKTQPNPKKKPNVNFYPQQIKRRMIKLGKKSITQKNLKQKITIKR
jgi:hypothetical protein